MFKREFDQNSIDSLAEKISLSGVTILDGNLGLSFAATLACFTYPRKKKISIGSGVDAKLRIIRCENADERASAIASILKEQNIEYDCLPKLQAFTNTYFTGRYFVTPDQTIIVVSGCDSAQNWYLLQSFIPLFLPDMFKDQPMTETEQNMLMLLIGNSYQAWVDAVNSILNSFGFERKLFNQKILMITKLSERRLLEETKKQVDAIGRNIEQYLNAYTEELRKYMEATKTYELKKFAFETKKEDRSLVDYLDAHPNIKIVGVNGNIAPEITLITSGYIDMFDADMFKSYAKRGGDGFYIQLAGNTAASSTEELGNFKILMNALFMPNYRYKIRSYAGYFVTCGRGVRAISCSSDNIRSVNANIPADRLENPHYSRFHCLGQNGPTLNKAAIEGDYVRMFEIMQVAAGNVNIAETSQTFAPFCRTIWMSRDKKIIEEEGSANQLTPLEVIAKIKENQTRECV